MTTMRYKDYVFPQNPARLEIAVENQLAGAHCPGYGPVYQALGPARRIITGEGDFFGPGAEEDYRALERLFFEEGPGMLFLPTMVPVRAYFTRLSYLGQGDGAIIRYGFQFVEDLMPGRGKGGEDGGGIPAYS